MFTTLQILFSMILGIVLVITGIVELVTKRDRKNQGWVYIGIALFLQLCWVAIVMAERAQTITD